MRIVVGGLTGSGWERLERTLGGWASLVAPAGRVLELAGPGAPEPGLRDLADRTGPILLTLDDVDSGPALDRAARLLDGGPDTLLIIGYASPGEAAAHALLHGRAPDAALQGWAAGAGAALAFMDARPEAVLLVHVDAALGDLQAFAARLADHAGAEIPALSSERAAGDGRLALFMQAGASLADDAELADLFERLEAVSAMGGGDAVLPDAQELVKAGRARASERAARAADLAQAARRKDEALDKREAALARLKDERRRQLNAQEAMRSEYEARLEALGGALKAERERAQALERRLALIHASPSWKVVDFLRALAAPWRKLTSRSSSGDRAALVRGSEFFDAHWYQSRYRDVADSGFDPAEHYLRAGWREGRDPGPRFSSSAYLELHADVARAGLNPLVHYLETGRMEQRAIAPAQGGAKPAEPGGAE